MPRLICKFQDGPTAYYLEWSTVVDAPVTNGMSLEDFTAHYQKRYGEYAVLYDLPARMARTEARGTSLLEDTSLDSLLAFNRAGRDETNLTREQIVDYYCRRQGQGEKPIGTSNHEEEGKT